ncbi:family 16 glycosylhydrolase [Roseivirga sp. E12]|uniref:glycoside hydrolase family 16 protein n=1 Tax=Roseivirga sp. E12 TaxID=2819237 RepID=UPI001F42D5FC|nr:glycoside hydrolase family 16 protein [Roseivirga sp. E12]
MTFTKRLLKTKSPLLLALVLIMIFSSCNSQQPGLVWSDEFNGSELDKEKWSAIIGDGCPALCGFGNNELQYYSENSQNLKIEDGRLIITAVHDSIENSAYSSAKVASKGKGDWKYGRVEVSAKLPSGKGTWPAIWMLPSNNKYGGWPRSGEIDIMEHVGYNQGMIYGTVHTQSFNHMNGTQRGDSTMIEDASETFHEYAIEWREDRIDWFIDGEYYHTFDNTGKDSDDWPFDHPFHVILNLAVGGSWGGSRGIDDSIWPQSMEIDYVRIYAF